jgi:hypothetical protein
LTEPADYYTAEQLRGLYGIIREPAYLYYCEICWFFSARPEGLRGCRCWHPSLSYAGREWRRLRDRERIPSELAQERRQAWLRQGWTPA